MDDRTQPPGDGWPLPMSTVLKALEADEEVLLDLGPAGTLVVRWRPRFAEPGPDLLPPMHDLARQVLRLVAEGLPAASVSEVMGLPLPAVAHELTALRTRYGVDSTAAAVAVARAVGDLD